MTDTQDTHLPEMTPDTDQANKAAADPQSPLPAAPAEPAPDAQPAAEADAVASPIAQEASATPEPAQDEEQAPTSPDAPDLTQPTEVTTPEPEASEPQPTEAEETGEPQNEEEVAETPDEEIETGTETEASEPQAEAGGEPEAAAPTPTLADIVGTLSKEEVVARAQALATSDAEAAKADVDLLKQAFYRLHNAEQEAAIQAFIAQGGNPDEYVNTPDPLEDEFKQVLTALRNKRNAANAELEKQKEHNLQVKLAIIEELKELVESPDDTNKNFAEFKKLQQQWNEVKLIPQGKVNELWKSYQHYVEKFYDLLKLNNEFREYDFRKNLAAKLLICETAERLAQDTDVVGAFHQLQKLHQQFRDIGPVARDMREQVWARFKAASTTINRRHQQHYEALKEAERNNLEQKIAICEIIEGIDFDSLKTFSAWDNQTREIIALQAKWKTIGFAPQKMNVKIFERFRKACDIFFQRKGEFFKTLKDEMSANLEKKRALCEQAEALKESDDWRATSTELSRLQKEWKAIGPVAKKHSDAIWKRFIGACDYFFERKARATSAQKGTELDNLQRKRDVIRQLQDIDEELNQREGARQVVDLMREWNSIGHVPFRDKDKLQKQYRTIVDHLTEVFNISPQGSRQARTYARQQGGQGSASTSPTGRERDRLVRTYEALKAELQTYENNLGFLTASSSKGSSLVDELKRKAGKLSDDISAIKAQIQAIDDAAQAAEDAPVEGEPSQE